jgi:hypothetical protein
MKKTKKAKKEKKIAPVAANIGQGDKLARGAIKATFNMPLVTRKKWDDVFADFDPEKFKKEGMPPVESQGKEINKRG